MNPSRATNEHASQTQKKILLLLLLLPSTISQKDFTKAPLSLSLSPSRFLGKIIGKKRIWRLNGKLNKSYKKISPNYGSLQAGGTSTSSSPAGTDEHIPMVLHTLEISTVGPDEPLIHEPPVLEAHLEDPSAGAAIEACLEDALVGEPYMEEVAAAIADNVPLHLYRPRRIVKRPRFGTE